MKYYKVLGKNGKACHGGSGSWHLPKNGKPGKWMPKIENIEPCVRGYHLCEAVDLLEWLNEEIYEAEGRGKSIRHDNKTVFEQARLIRKINAWNEKTARLFACECAERVLPIFERERPDDDRPRKVIEAARKYADGLISKEEIDAARAAARGAAWDAAGAAAWAAARGAARDAARDAAWAAAWAAARAAARAAEKKWQTERLMKVLRG